MKIAGEVGPIIAHMTDGEMASTEPAMKIAGESSRGVTGRSRGTRFNGAGDEDRRREERRWHVERHVDCASTEPAMKIAGEGSRNLPINPVT